MKNVFIDQNLQKNRPEAAFGFCPSGLAVSGWSSIPRNAPSGDHGLGIACFNLKS